MDMFFYYNVHFQLIHKYFTTTISTYLKITKRTISPKNSYLDHKCIHKYPIKTISSYINNTKPEQLLRSQKNQSLYDLETLLNMWRSWRKWFIWICNSRGSSLVYSNGLGNKRIFVSFSPNLKGENSPWSNWSYVLVMKRVGCISQDFFSFANANRFK